MSNIYHLQAFGVDHEVSDYAQEVREAVVIAPNEQIARRMIPCEDECCHRESPLHASECFWMVSEDVHVTVLGPALEGLKASLVTIRRERGSYGGA